MSRKLFSAAVALLTFSSLLHAQAMKVDGVHSSIVFNVRHLEISPVWGRINNPSGSVHIDDANLGGSSVQVDAKVENIDTAHPGRDAHLKGPDFFDGKQFPDVSFKSKSIKKAGDNKYEVAGEFTLHGQTKPLTVTLTKLGEGDKGQRFGYRAGYETSFTIKRSDYGMTGMIPMIGDEVTIFVGLEVTK